MSNRNFDSSALIKRLADKAIAKNIFSSCNIQPQTSNLSASVINQAHLGNSLNVSRGPTCTTIDYGCPCQANEVVSQSLPVAQWAAYFDTITSDQGRSIITDSYNNVYMTGFYNSSTVQPVRNSNLYNYIPTGITLPATNAEAVFLIKYNSLGFVQWATYFNGTGNDRGLSLDIDSFDNIYLTGFYTTTADRNVQNASGNGQTPSSIILPASAAVSNAFLIKYSPSGVAQWATYLSGSSNAQGKNVKIDSSNNVCITGYYNSSTSVFVQDVSGNGQTPSSISLFTPTTNASNSVFLIKYNSSGIAQWASYLDSSGNDEGNGIAFDSFDNVYLTGFYNSTILLDVKHSNIYSYNNSGILLTGGSNNGYFLIKYDSSGLVQWATCQRGDTINGVTGNSIAIDSNNNVYVVGNSNNTGSNLTYEISNAITSGSSYPNSGLKIARGQVSFLIKYNSSGIVQWGTYFDADLQSTLSVVIDLLNNIYISGEYSSGTSINTIPINNGYTTTNVTQSNVRLPLTGGGGQPQAAFLVKYNSNGLVQWATYLNSDGNDSGRNIAIDSLNNVYLSGYYRNAATTVWNTSNGTIYNSSGITLPVTSGNDVAFLIKYT